MVGTFKALLCGVVPPELSVPQSLGGGGGGWDVPPQPSWVCPFCHSTQVPVISAPCGQRLLHN